MFTTDTDSKFNQSQPANRFSENVQVAMGAMPIVDRINGEIVFNTDHGPSVLLRFGRNGWWLTVSRHEKTGGENGWGGSGDTKQWKFEYWTCRQWLRYRHHRAHQQWTPVDITWIYMEIEPIETGMVSAHKNWLADMDYPQTYWCDHNHQQSGRRSYLLIMHENWDTTN